MGKANKLLQQLALVVLKAYRYLISPWLGSRCRFYPSCSQYARTAIELHGFYRGAGLSLQRLLRCHPWHHGGCDFVPDVKLKK